MATSQRPLSGLLAACTAALLFAALGAGSAIAGDCDTANINLELSFVNTCNFST